MEGVPKRAKLPGGTQVIVRREPVRKTKADLIGGSPDQAPEGCSVNFLGGLENAWKTSRQGKT
jgi:hypothetical protein